MTRPKSLSKSKSKFIPYYLIFASLVALGIMVTFLLKPPLTSVSASNILEEATPPGSMALTIPWTPEEIAAQKPADAPKPTPSPSPSPTVIKAPVKEERAPVPTPAPKRAIIKPVTPLVKNLVVVKTSPSAQTKNDAAPQVCSGGFAPQFLCLLNQYRASQNKGKLIFNSSLASVALSHSNWINSTGTFSHTGINGSRLGDRCSAAGVSCHAENLAEGASSPQNLLDMWKNSPGHNANLLGPYTTFGLGVSGNYVTALWN